MKSLVLLFIFITLFKLGFAQENYQVSLEKSFQNDTKEVAHAKLDSLLKLYPHWSEGYLYKASTYPLDWKKQLKYTNVSLEIDSSATALLYRIYAQKKFFEDKINTALFHTLYTDGYSSSHQNSLYSKQRFVLEKRLEQEYLLLQKSFSQEVARAEKAGVEKNAFYYFLSGIRFQYEGKFQEMEMDFEKGIDVFGQETNRKHYQNIPDLASQLYNGLFQAKARRGKYEELRTLYDKIPTYLKEEENIKISLAEVYFVRNDYEKVNEILADGLFSEMTELKAFRWLNELYRGNWNEGKKLASLFRNSFANFILRDHLTNWVLQNPKTPQNTLGGKLIIETLFMKQEVFQIEGLQAYQLDIPLARQEAITFCDRFLAQQPDNIYFQVYRLKYLGLLGHISTLEEDFNPIWKEIKNKGDILHKVGYDLFDAMFYAGKYHKAYLVHYRLKTQDERTLIMRSKAREALLNYTRSKNIKDFTLPLSIGYEKLFKSKDLTVWYDNGHFLEYLTAYLCLYGYDVDGLKMLPFSHSFQELKEGLPDTEWLTSYFLVTTTEERALYKRKIKQIPAMQYFLNKALSK